jgi:hypothetical protein
MAPDKTMMRLEDLRPNAAVRGVLSLPQQITAVYEFMLPRQPLRFLLADDPGAGKTRHDDLQLTVSGFSFALHRPDICLS